jgi:ABC-type nitrate/sulfonate/bicarbonate transport system substrate-binding protein
MAKKLKPVRIGYRHNLEILSFILRDSGLLQKYGLDPDVRHIPDSAEGNEALYKGEIDIFLGNHISPMVERQNRGAKFVYLAQPSNIWPPKLIVKPWIKDVKDLRGKGFAMGGGGRGNHADLANRHMLEKAGIDLKRDGIEEVVLRTDRINWYDGYQKFLHSDDVSATLLHPPFDEIAQKDGLRILDIPEYPQIHNVTINAIRDTLEAKPEVTLAFLRAYCEAIHFFKTQKQKTVEILWEALASKLKFDDAAIERLYEDVNSTMQKKPYPSMVAIENTYEITRRAFPEVEGMNPLSMWDLHYLRQLDDEGFIDELYKR